MRSANVVLATAVASFLAVLFPPIPLYGAAFQLQDTFDSTATSDAYPADYGLNQELAQRQSGTLAPLSYIGSGAGPYATQVNHPAYAGKLLLATWAPSADARAILDYDFDSAPHVTVSALLNPAVAVDQGVDPSATWMALSARLGSNSYPASQLLADQDGVTFRIGQLGAWDLFANGASVAGGAALSSTQYDVTMTLLGDQVIVNVNGVDIDLNGALAGVAMTLTGPAATATTSYVGVSAGNVGQTGMILATVDDLTVAMPEPATVSLLAIGGLALLRRKR